MVPQNAPPTPSVVFHGQDARLLRYQDVLTKITANGQSTNITHQLADSYISDGWISEEDDVEVGPLAKPADVRSLLGGFADAETME
jgi:hypothetical protein